MTRELYHGADANKMLFNIRNGALTADSQGRVFFAEREWQNCLVHGTDSETLESYAAKFRVEIPNGAPLAQSPTSGNRDARILTLAPGAQVKAQILELYVRRGKIGSFQFQTIPQNAIQQYLTDRRKAVEQRNNLLRQLSDKCDRLSNLYELDSSDHKTQLDLATNSIAGFVVGQFNKPAPPIAIWNNTYGRLLATRRYINSGDVARATAELQVARLWYLFASKKYLTWKNGIEAAGKKAEWAIGETAVAVVATFVVAALAAGALTGWAGWGASATGGASASAQTLTRIAASVDKAERVIRVADAYEKEQEMLEAIEEAESELSELEQ